MRICINAAAANQGGAVTYLLNLLPQLARLEGDDRYLVIAPDATLERVAGVLDDSRFDYATYPHAPARFARRVLFDQVDVPSIARRFGADLLYSANGFGSLVTGRAEALLVRNSAYFSRLLEEKLRALDRSPRDLQLRRAWSLLSMRRASAVLFPSRAMQERVGDYISLSRKPTRAIHYGFDPSHFFTDQRPDESLLERLREWRGAGRRVLIYVSGYAVHKNFETAVEAMALLLSGGTDVGLLLTAEWKPFGEMVQFEAMMDRIRELGIEDRVLMPGQQEWAHLHALYSLSDVHLWPTLLESFGHPMLEAMASGLPTVASDTEVNREILADAGLYFDAIDASACAQSVRAVIEDDGLAERLKTAAADRVRDFTWRAHARALHDFFGEIAPSRR